MCICICTTPAYAVKTSMKMAPPRVRTRSISEIIYNYMRLPRASRCALQLKLFYNYMRCLGRGCIFYPCRGASAPAGSPTRLHPRHLPDSDTSPARAPGRPA